MTTISIPPETRMSRWSEHRKALQRLKPGDQYVVDFTPQAKVKVDSAVDAVQAYFYKAGKIVRFSRRKFIDDGGNTKYMVWRVEPNSVTDTAE